MTELSRTRAERGGAYHSFLDVPALSAGIYELKVNARDGQQPHARDEIYYVEKGRATLVSDGTRTNVEPGTVIYVRRGADHRFVDIREDLRLLVIFAGDRTPTRTP